MAKQIATPKNFREDRAPFGITPKGFTLGDLGERAKARRLRLDHYRQQESLYKQLLALEKVTPWMAVIREKFVTWPPLEPVFKVEPTPRLPTIMEQKPKRGDKCCVLS